MFVRVQLFSEMLTEDHSRQDVLEIRDLAKRLAMSFGVDLNRVRKPLVALHMSVTHVYSNTYRQNLLILFTIDQSSEPVSSYISQ